jgi:hypothetical protein
VLTPHESEPELDAHELELVPKPGPAMPPAESRAEGHRAIGDATLAAPPVNRSVGRRKDGELSVPLFTSFLYVLAGTFLAAGIGILRQVSQQGYDDVYVTVDKIFLLVLPIVVYGVFWCVQVTQKRRKNAQAVNPRKKWLMMNAFRDKWAMPLHEKQMKKAVKHFDEIILEYQKALKQVDNEHPLSPEEQAQDGHECEARGRGQQVALEKLEGCAKALQKASKTYNDRVKTWQKSLSKDGAAKLRNISRHMAQGTFFKPGVAIEAQGSPRDHHVQCVDLDGCQACARANESILTCEPPHNLRASRSVQLVRRLVMLLALTLIF